LNGWIICWGASDWFGALGAFAWIPWAWWGLERALDRQRNAGDFLWPAPFVYLVVSGGFPYTVLMLVLFDRLVGLPRRSLARRRVDLADVVWRSARFWIIRAGVAGAFGLTRDGSFREQNATGRRALANGSFPGARCPDSFCRAGQ